MKVLFVADRRVDAGSVQALANYSRAGDKLGHTMAVYGSPDPRFADIHFSTDVQGFDHLVFIFESKLRWMSGLQLARILAAVPRHRRAILDADGMYNRAIVLDGYDRNHATERDRAEWLAYYDELADRIFQPTVAPQEAAAEPLLFYGYDPDSVIPVQPPGQKVFDILHVAHNWWRWRELSSRLLPALEEIRPRVGPIAFIGAWWQEPPPWARALGLEAAFAVDSARLRRLAIELRPPVPFHDVVATMSAGRLNIMTQRPLLRHLRFVTSKYFELFTADTAPLVMLDADHAELVYGPAGRSLALDGQIGERVLDALARPPRYRELVESVRAHLSIHHSYRQRVLELVSALEGRRGAAARGR
jgi:hypothetical protein